MSTQADQRKSVRVIASNALQRGKLRTVNIRTTTPPDRLQAKECLQVTAVVAAAQPAGTVETVMDSGGTVAGLPTIFIAGYAAPN